MDSVRDLAASGHPPTRARRHAAKLAVSAGVAIAIVGAFIVGAHVRATPSAVAASTPIVALSESTTTQVPAATPRSSADAALQLYFAWQRGDRTRAASVATTNAWNDLFFNARIAAAGLSFRGCTASAAVTVKCSWTRRGGRLDMQVSPPGRVGAQVQSVDLR